MLLEFRTKKYKSYVEETVFSMTKAPKQSGLDYSLLGIKIKKKSIKGLCSSVVYGPNPASGALELIPNNKLTESEPVEFSIDFYENDFRIQYDLDMDLGLFLDEVLC